MRILVAHNVPRSRNTGMSRIMECTHDEIQRAGHTVEYFSADSVSSSFAKGRLARLGFPLALVNFLREQACQGKTFDIVNVHEPAGAPVALLRSALGKAKLVVTSHGIEERSWKQGFASEADPQERPSLKTRVIYPATLLWQANFALRHSDHVFCLNEEDRSYLVHRFGRRQEDLTRIFPAADPLYGARAAVRDYSRAAKILFAGSWILRKGIGPLTEALNRLLVNHPNLIFTALNPGVPDSAILDSFAPEVRSRVETLKTAYDRQAVKVFEASDIFVLPSLFEGTPLTLMEAMWSGLAIVTTDTCGMKDVLRQEENGLLVPMRSASKLEAALNRLITDHNLRRALGERAHQDARTKFRWEISAQVALDGYQRALAQ